MWPTPLNEFDSHDIDYLIKFLKVTQKQKFLYNVEVMCLLLLLFIDNPKYIFLNFCNSHGFVKTLAYNHEF